MSTMSVFLIEPNQLFREGLKELLSGHAFLVAGEAATVSAAALVLEGNGPSPDLILVDPVDMTEGIGALRALAPESRIVVLTSDLCPRSLSGVLEAGVRGCLTRDISCDVLVQSLQLVMLGEMVFPTNLAELFKGGRASRSLDAVARQGGGVEFSKHEAQMLRCLMRGKSNRMIAGELGITEAAVKVHLKGLLRRIKAMNRTQAAVWARNNGFDEPAETPGSGRTIGWNQGTVRRG